MLIYDIEIKKAILGKGEKPIEGIEYCTGWNDHEAMGVSTVCCYDYEEDRYRVFCEDNLREFALLVERHDTIVGFNNIGFDNKVLAYVIPRGENIEPINVKECLDQKSYDIFAKIRDAGGGWCSLDGMIKANFLTEGKTGNGAMAPVWYQSGQWGKLVDYCLADVWLTKKLLDIIISGQKIISPKTGMYLKIEKP